MMAAEPSENGRSVLPSYFGLLPNTNQYLYQDREHFLSISGQEYHRFVRDQSHSQYFILLDINLNTYLRDFEEQRCDSYFPFLKMALIEMASSVHEITARVFESLLLDKLSTMNSMSTKLDPLGSAEVETNTRRKQPDNSYRPRRLPRNRSRKWPTFTVEVGFSEPTRKHEDDAKWWLSQSNGDVRIVLTIDVHRRTNMVIFKTWTLNSQRVPEATYRVVLSGEDGMRRIRTTNNNPLIIPFESLFLRPADDNSERDITFSLDDLKEIATRAWEEKAAYHH